MKINTTRTFTKIEKKLVNSILGKLEIEKEKSNLKLISFIKLFGLLTKKEQALINKILDIKPFEYGIHTPYLGINEVPEDLVAIKNQKYSLKGITKKVEIQYLPKPVYLACQKLNTALSRDQNLKLLIGSGYRSPAYQAFVFLWYLQFYKFNFLKTVRRVGVPGYSEHGFPEKQAIDFMTTNGSPSEKNPLDFAKTFEYKWLLKNAQKFNFYLSCPPNNKLGIMYEPWHWRHEINI